MQAFKEWLSTRGAQLAARYACQGAISIATACGLSGQWPGLLGAALGAIVLDRIDHWSHRQQAEKTLEEQL